MKPDYKISLSRHQWFMNIIPLFFVVLGLFLIYASVRTSSNEASVSRESAKPIRVYNIATNCFLAVPASERTNTYIERCYDKAETIVGAKVERFNK